MLHQPLVGTRIGSNPGWALIVSPSASSHYLFLLPGPLFSLQADVSADDMLQDDDITPLGEVPDCDALDANNPIYSAKALCLDNASADAKCPDNAYGVMVVEDGAVNAWNEKMKAFKVCGWCPAGTTGDGFGCSTCPAGQFSLIGGACEECPAGTYSNAGECQLGFGRSSDACGTPTAVGCDARCLVGALCALCAGACTELIERSHLPFCPLACLLACLCFAGSAYCIPCPQGTYSDASATAECTEW